MSKLKLYGISKQENRVHFRLGKKQAFLDVFRKILLRFGFWDARYWHYDEIKDKDDKINNLTDFCDHLQNEKYDIDIIFGKKRIIVIVRAKQKDKDKFIKELNKFCEWAKIRRRLKW